MFVDFAIKTLFVVFDKICYASKIYVMAFQRSEKIFFFFRKFRFRNDFTVYGLDVAIFRNGFAGLKRLLSNNGFFKRGASKFISALLFIIRQKS
jgi:hypothetical protein